MSAAISLPWQPTSTSRFCRSVDLPGSDGGFQHRQLYPEYGMSECVFWTTTPVDSLADALRLDLLHRPDGPAVSWFLFDSTLANEQWWLCGQLHRVDGPAFISYAQLGGEFRQWVEDGQVLREERV